VNSKFCDITIDPKGIIVVVEALNLPLYADCQQAALSLRTNYLQGALIENYDSATTSALGLFLSHEASKRNILDDIGAARESRSFVLVAHLFRDMGNQILEWNPLCALFKDFGKHTIPFEKCI